MTTPTDQVSEEVKAIAADLATKIDAALEAKEITEDQKGVLLQGLTDLGIEKFAETFESVLDEAKAATKLATEAAEKEAADKLAVENAIHKIQLPASARSALRAVRKLEGVVLESTDKITTVTYRTGDREAVLESAKEFLVNGDPSVHEVVGDGHSLYGVLESAGFAAENISAMATIFEAAVNERVSAMEAAFDTKVSEKAALAVESMQDDLDAYVAKAIGTWTADNKIAIEHAVRLQNAEEFISTISKAFESIGLHVPEDKKDIVSEMEAKLAAANAALEEAELKSAELSTKVLAAETASRIDAAVAKFNISDAGKDRLFVMLEDFGLERFSKSFDLIVESFFGEKTPKAEVEKIEIGDGKVAAESIIDGAKPSEKAPAVPYNPYAKHLKVMKIR